MDLVVPGWQHHESQNAGEDLQMNTVSRESKLLTLFHNKLIFINIQVYSVSFFGRIVVVLPKLQFQD